MRPGDEIRTRGGWLARVLWVDRKNQIYCLHQPGTAGEYGPVFHEPDGTARPMFGVMSPPTYGDHPADLVL